MNHITKEHITAKIAKVAYHRIPDTTLTLCVLTMENGFNVTGESACADPANFNKQTGEMIAYDNAFEKLWQLEGYLLKQKMFESGRTPQAPQPQREWVGSTYEELRELSKHGLERFSGQMLHRHRIGQEKEE
jgi:hypothetical protein